MSINSGQLKFSNNIVSDNYSKYWLFYTSTFNTSGATLIEDVSGNTISGNVSGNFEIDFLFDYDSLLETDYTAVFIGLEKSQYVIVEGSFLDSTTVIDIYASNELNYSAFSGISWSNIYDLPTSLEGYGIEGYWTSAQTIDYISTITGTTTGTTDLSSYWTSAQTIVYIDSLTGIYKWFYRRFKYTSHI